MSIIKCFNRNVTRLAAVAALALAAVGADAERWAGGDVSLLPDYEKAGAQYKTTDGKPIASLLPWLREQGMNAMRVRLFVNPKDYTGPDADPNACQTLEYITPLCQDIKKAGLGLMLDFHYSDTWADPGKQWTPATWAGLSDEELFVKIYEYTKSQLEALKAAGVTPDFIQPGNEISYGMLWGPYGTPEAELKKTFMGNPANWQRLGNLLNEAIRACREVCPEAKIIIHTERTAAPDVQRNFYDWMKTLGVDYDIIGLSYYPYFHGKLSQLDESITQLETRYPDKNIMVVEAGYPYAWEIPGTSEPMDYPYTEEGQNQFAKDLVAMLEKHKAVDGLFWWWLEYNAYGTSFTNWYNAPLFDSRNGRATPALHTIASFATHGGSGATPVITAPEASLSEASEAIHDLDGRRVDAPEPGRPYVSNRRVIILTD